MSAFVVDAAHIDVLLSAAINGPSDCFNEMRDGWRPPYVDELLGVLERLGPRNADAAGAALLGECIASVRHLYPDLRDELPGSLPTPDPAQYEWTDFGTPMTAIECCKAIACFEYQSRAHPDWKQSGARGFCAQLRAEMVSCMNGYKEAPWEWDVERALARAPRRWGI